MKLIERSVIVLSIICCISLKQIDSLQASSEEGRKEGVCDHTLCGQHGKCEVIGSHAYFCRCSYHYTGAFCNVTATALTDINECLKPSSCPKNSSCINIPGSYNCICDAGFRNKSDNVKKDGCTGVCDHTLCGQHGKCEVIGSHAYYCRCSYYYTGAFCNVTATALTDVRREDITTSVIVGVVLNGALIIILILGLVYYKRFKRAENKDDEYSKHKERAIYSEKKHEVLKIDLKILKESTEKHGL